MSALYILIALAVASLAPNRDNSVAVDAIESVVSESLPLFANDEEKLKTAALVVSMAYRESSFRNDAKSKTNDHCLMQVNARPELAYDARECVRVAMRMLRESMAACGKGNELGLYATGSCTSERGKRISRDRMWLARRILPQ